MPISSWLRQVPGSPVWLSVALIRVWSWPCLARERSSFCLVVHAGHLKQATTLWLWKRHTPASISQGSWDRRCLIPTVSKTSKTLDESFSVPKFLPSFQTERNNLPHLGPSYQLFFLLGKLWLFLIIPCHSWPSFNVISSKRPQSKVVTQSLLYRHVLALSHILLVLWFGFALVLFDLYVVQLKCSSSY